jgi:hypothetical protein
MRVRLFNLKNPIVPSSASTDKSMQKQLRQLTAPRINPPATQQGNFYIPGTAAVDKFLAYQGEIAPPSPMDISPRNSAATRPQVLDYIRDYQNQVIDYQEVARQRNPYGLRISTDGSSTTTSNGRSSTSNVSAAAYDPKTEKAVGYKPGAGQKKKKVQKPAEKLVI